MSSLQLRRHDPLRLLQRSGSTAASRPSHRSRRAARSSDRRRRRLHIVEAEAHDHGKFIDEGRLEGGEPVLRHADQGRRDRLMRAAFRRQRHARRRRHHEAGILVAGIVQGIEAALMKGSYSVPTGNSRAPLI
jgi:hypothetical protein